MSDIKMNEKELKSFFQAALWGQKKELKSFLKKFGPESLALRNEDGRTVLHHAAGQGLTKIAKFLLKNGADVNARDHHGRTPLHLAASSNFKDLYVALKKNGADDRVTDNNGWTVAHYAAKRSNLSVLKEIYKDGFLINPLDKDSKTPLHLCVHSMAYTDVALFLLEMGADPRAKDRNGQSPLSIAADAREENLSHLLYRFTTDREKGYTHRPV